MIWSANNDVTVRGEEVARLVKLQPGERVLFCPKCPWISEKGIVAYPFCPECNARLRYLNG